MTARAPGALTLIAAATCLHLFGATALAAAPMLPAPSFSISPAITELQGRPPMSLPGSVVRNTTSQSVRVRAYPVLVDQARDGGLLPRMGRIPRRQAARFVRVVPSSFSLAPGASVTLSERWRRPAPGRRGFSQAIMIDAVPVGAPRLRLRLMQALLLTPPNGPAPRARIAAIDMAVSRGHVSNLSIRVFNPGTVHAWVSGSLQLLALSGRRSMRLRSALPRVVLARATRDIALPVAGRLSPGRYRAVATIAVGGVSTRRVFTLRIA